MTSSEWVEGFVLYWSAWGPWLRASVSGGEIVRLSLYTLCTMQFEWGECQDRGLQSCIGVHSQRKRL